MNHSIEKTEKYIIIRLNEEKLNDLISTELKSQLMAINQEGARNIILDLSNTTYCDSSGLSAILVGNKLCKNSNGSFVICGLKDKVKRLVTISQLEKILLIVPTIEEGIDLIFMEEIERDLINDSNNH